MFFVSFPPAKHTTLVRIAGKSKRHMMKPPPVPGEERNRFKDLIGEDQQESKRIWKEKLWELEAVLTEKSRCGRDSLLLAGTNTSVIIFRDILLSFFSSFLFLYLSCFYITFLPLIVISLFNFILYFFLYK